MTASGATEDAAVDTISADLFLAMHDAVRAGILMQPRSKDDKEYFPQDWFADRAKNIPGISVYPQGRNSYPDFWVERAGRREGFEIKSLAFTGGKPARSDIDFNSTIPSRLKSGNTIFLVFFLYTDSGANPRPVHSLVLAHADLMNADYALADQHVNQSIGNFGSYGDGFIRNRKMYRFPHPLAIYPEGIGHLSLIVPAEWEINASRLRRIGTISRTIVAERLSGYYIGLQGGAASTTKEVAPRGGQRLVFQVLQHG